MFEGVPPDLVEVAERHGQVVVAYDREKIIGDFRPDRVGQLIASAKLPPNLVSSKLLRIEPGPDDLMTAFICYKAADGTETVLRSRWIRLPEGWRVAQVRNIPETAPRMASTGPAEDGRDTPHWEGLRAGELRVQRCADCGTWIWAPRPICPACHSFSLEWPAVEPTGTVYSWTRTWQPFTPEFSGHLPFVTLLVELPAAGHRRLLGVLLDADGVTPRIGQAVTGEIESADTADGWPVLRWRLA